MRSHLAILKQMLKSKGFTQKDIAVRLGYESASAVGMMLRGERSMGRVELEKMCVLAGTTIVGLSALSDDLHVMKSDDAAEGAAILDEMTPQELAAILPLLRSYRKPRPDR